MKAEPNAVYQLKLSARQREEVKELTGKEAESISLTVEELEDRISPRLAAN